MRLDGAILSNCAARAKTFALVAVIALGVFATLLVAAGKDPLRAYADTLFYVFGNAYGFSELLVRMIPLLLTAVAAALPARIGLINVGAEGQLYMGAWLATAGALAFPRSAGFCSFAAADGVWLRRRRLVGAHTGRVAGVAARQRDHLDAVAQLCCAADRELFHLRALAQPGELVLSAISGLCRSRAAADFLSFAGASRPRLRLGLAHPLFARHDADPLRSRHAGDRRQSGSARVVSASRYFASS